MSFGARSFEKLVLQDERTLWVVEFYADWCGHCKQFAKGYEKAATNLKGVVRFGAVNADSSNSKKTSQSQGVQGFPSVKVYVPGTAQRNPYTGKMFKPAIEYQGPRSARGMVDFATQSLPSQVLAVTDKTLKSFKTNGTLPKALLFTAKTETTALFKSLSVSFAGRMLVGEARDTASKAASELGVTEYPTLVVLPADGGSTIAYKGELKPDALNAFLEEHAAPPPEASADADAAADNFVTEVSAANVATAVEGERGAWLLVFAGSESNDLSSEGGVATLAETLHGQVKVGRASSDLAAKFGVTLGSAPVVAMWPFRKAGVARKASTFAGDEAGVAAAKKAALETLTDEGVTAINQATMDRWMQESLMTSETRAFCMLFSDKPAVPPLMRALSLEFEGKMGFGMAQAKDKMIADRFNVQKAPTLLVMFPDESKKGEDGQTQLAGMQFNPQMHGKFNFGNIASFLGGFVEMRLSQLKGGGGPGGDGDAGGENPERAPKATRDVGPPPELSAESFSAECVSKGGLCGIAMLDGSEANAASKGHSIEMLTKLRSRRAGGPISFSWLDATCHTSFAAAFELSEADLPTMIFLSPQKLKWARSVGAFDAETLGVFGAGVAAGRKSTNTLSELPTLEDVDCATVKRGADAVEIEEDGADDIMAEILEEERRAREEREAALAAEGVAESAAQDTGKKKPKSEMSKLEALEADVEECEAMDLLCSARREKQLKAVEKQRDLEEKLRKIAKKKKKAKKAKAKA